MNKAIAVFLYFLLLTGVSAAAQVVYDANLAPNPPCASIEAYFSPDGGITDAIVREIRNAQYNIHVQAYSFTSARIAGALAAATAKGIHVYVILDKSNVTAKYSVTDYFRHHEIIPLIDSRHAIAHNKIIIIDDRTVITGSFNFTKAAEEKNAENIVVIRDREIALKYLANWKLHAGHSKAYEGRE